MKQESGRYGINMKRWCREHERSVREALEAHPDATDITVLIGPEGDFSPEEVTAAVAEGYIPVHLGTSRLRTETAAVAAAAFVAYSRLPWRQTR